MSIVLWTRLEAFEERVAALEAVAAAMRKALDALPPCPPHGHKPAGLVVCIQLFGDDAHH